VAQGGNCKKDKLVGAAALSESGLSADMAGPEPIGSGTVQSRREGQQPRSRMVGEAGSNWVGARCLVLSGFLGQ
jgi:hypothetical protein